jgi:hypothetical protein
MIRAAFGLALRVAQPSFLPPAGFRWLAIADIRRLRELALAGDRRALDLQRRILAESAKADEDRFDPEKKSGKFWKRSAAWA